MEKVILIILCVILFIALSANSYQALGRENGVSQMPTEIEAEIGVYQYSSDNSR